MSAKLGLRRPPSLCRNSTPCAPVQSAACRVRRSGKLSTHTPSFSQSNLKVVCLKQLLSRLWVSQNMDLCSNRMAFA